MTTGDGAQRSILLPLEVFTVAITEGLSPDGGCVIDDAATNCLVSCQEHLLAAPQLVPASFLRMLLCCLTMAWVLFAWCEKVRRPSNVTPSTFTVRQVGRAAPANEMFSRVFSCFVQVMNCVADDFPMLRMRLRCSSQVANWTR